ncbi:MAG: glycosyltransferase family 39 protein [Candidatus Omnitrophica bacterium]|nr:glycosyltransferase family 39 protein [Candidatus Omnitrophota bacterium]
MSLEKNQVLKLTAISLFLINLFMGLFFINEGLFHADSVALAQAVEKTYQTGQLQPAANGRYGAVIVNSMLYFPAYLFGFNADFITRFSSILFHALSIVALFLFIYELFENEIQAVLGALLLSFTPFYFSPNTYGKEHGMSLFFLLMSFYIVVRRGVKKESSLWLALASFLYVLSASVRESILITIPLYFLLYFYPEFSFRPFKIVIPKERFNWKILCSFALPLLGGIGIIYFSYLHNTFKQLSISMEYRGLFSYILKMALEDLFMGLPTPLFVLLILGIIEMVRKGKHFLAVFLLLWTMSIFYYGNINLYCLRYLDVVIIPIYIFVAYFLAILHEKYGLVAKFFILYFVWNMIMLMYPMLEFRHQYNGEKHFALFVQANTEPNALILTRDDSSFIQYYGHRETCYFPLEYDKPEHFIKEVEGSLRQHRPVYYTYIALDKIYEKVSFLRMRRYFNMQLVGEAISEDYHRPELEFQLYHQKLFKVNLRNH